MATLSTRAALSSELPELHCLLTGWTESEPTSAAAPTRQVLHHVLAHGRVRVAEADGVPVGCVAVETPSSDHIRLHVVAVRPDVRRTGIGSRLLREVLDGLPESPGERPTISAVVGTEELRSARFLLACGFIGARTLRTGQDDGVRLLFQHKVRIDYVDPDARHLVPVSLTDQLLESLEPADHAVTGVVALAEGPAFEITRFEQDDPATLQSGEAAAGISFSGALLAAITFLLGISFTSDRFPDDVRLILIGSTFSTMLSLIVYASASGELARIRANSFGRIMKWGNVLSEYGGVLPFLITLPVIYAGVGDNRWVTLVLAFTLSVAIGGYEWSEFSIAHRFRHTGLGVTLMALTAAFPLLGVAAVTTGTVSWPWALLVIVTLMLRTWLYLARHGSEAGIAQHRGQWQIRA
ncbi:GNAT family N-acetyltransferase [Streptomyces sp. GDS52]|uniref:GNAT family N-acetyltransferase n=1 Tax=Streptomyces cathayae TaxID=3031124 RepID=A0ABY8K4D5_9ACTN|nr:GNAT family N-acetyltransferase [Streptomyces sp. HUAS 5]WGD43085.1 GNAT family N-acetyltransferase [Streptomyces sp. HUAS 5]